MYTKKTKQIYINIIPNKISTLYTDLNLDIGIVFILEIVQNILGALSARLKVDRIRLGLIAGQESSVGAASVGLLLRAKIIATARVDIVLFLVIDLLLFATARLQVNNGLQKVNNRYLDPNPDIIHERNGHARLVELKQVVRQATLSTKLAQHYLRGLVVEAGERIVRLDRSRERRQRERGRVRERARRGRGRRKRRRLGQERLDRRARRAGRLHRGRLLLCFMISAWLLSFGPR